MRRLFDLANLKFMKSRRHKPHLKSAFVELLQSRTVPAAINSMPLLVAAESVEDEVASDSDAQAEAFYAATNDCGLAIEEQRFDGGDEFADESVSVMFYSFMARGGEDVDRGDESSDVAKDETVSDDAGDSVPRIYFMTFGGMADDSSNAGEEFDAEVVLDVDQVRFKGGVADVGATEVPESYVEEEFVLDGYDPSWSYRGWDGASSEVVDVEKSEAEGHIAEDVVDDSQIYHMSAGSIDEAPISDVEIYTFGDGEIAPADESNVGETDANADDIKIDRPVIYYFSVGGMEDLSAMSGQAEVADLSESSPDDVVLVRSTSSDLVVGDADSDSVAVGGQQIVSQAVDTHDLRTDLDTSANSETADEFDEDGNILSRDDESLPHIGTLLIDTLIAPTV